MFLKKTTKDLDESCLIAKADLVIQSPTIKDSDYLFVKVLAAAIRENSLTTHNVLSHLEEVLKIDSLFEDKKLPEQQICTLFFKASEDEKNRFSEKEFEESLEPLSREAKKLYGEILQDLLPLKADWIQETIEKSETSFLESVENSFSDLCSLPIKYFSSLFSKDADQSAIEPLVKQECQKIESLKQIAIQQKKSAEYLDSCNAAVKLVRELQTLKICSLLTTKSERRVKPIFRPLDEGLTQAIERFKSENFLALAAKCEDIIVLLAEKEFTVVIVGESKRGKSSLFNALIGVKLAEIQEVVPETAVPMTIGWGNSFKAKVSFLSEAEYNLAQAAVKATAASLPPWKKQAPLTLKNPKELRKYTSLSSPESAFVKEVRISFPSAFLKTGIKLIDTPALNSKNSFRNFQSYEKCLEGDCLLLCVSALHPESASEAYLMERLAKAGRGTSVACVVSSPDLLSSRDGVNKSVELAGELLAKAKELGMNRIFLDCINLKNCVSSDLGQSLFSSDLKKLSQLSDALISSHKAALENSQEEQQQLLKKVILALEEVKELWEVQKKQEEMLLPSSFEIEFLGKRTQALRNAFNATAEQIVTISKNVVEDINTLKTQLTILVDDWQTISIGQASQAAKEYANILDDEELFSPESWIQFDQVIFPKIVSDSINQLNQNSQHILLGYEKKVQTFTDVSLATMNSLQSVLQSANGNILGVSDRDLACKKLLTKAHTLLENSAVLGFQTFLGTDNKKERIIAVGTTIFKSASVLLPIIAFSGAALFALHKLGNKERCKKNLLEKKQDLIEEWAGSQKSQLSYLLCSQLDQITDSYKRAIKENLIPPLRSLAEEVNMLESYEKLCRKLRDEKVQELESTSTQIRELIKRAQAL